MNSQISVEDKNSECSIDELLFTAANLSNNCVAMDDPNSIKKVTKKEKLDMNDSDDILFYVEDEESQHKLESDSVDRVRLESFSFEIDGVPVEYLESRFGEVISNNKAFIRKILNRNSEKTDFEGFSDEPNDFEGFPSDENNCQIDDKSKETEKIVKCLSDEINPYNKDISNINIGKKRKREKSITLNLTEPKQAIKKIKREPKKDLFESDDSLDEFEGFPARMVLKRTCKSKHVYVDDEIISNISKKDVVISPKINDSIGSSCDQVNCSISWLESGDALKIPVNINNGMVYELSKFAKKIAWEPEYVAEWILRLRGYKNVKPCKEDLKKIYLLLKRRKALTITLSGKNILKQKLKSFDTGSFFLPTAEKLDNKHNLTKSPTFHSSNGQIKLDIFDELPTITKSNPKIDDELIISHDNDSVVANDFNQNLSVLNDQSHSEDDKKPAMDPTELVRKNNFNIKNNFIGDHCDANKIDIKILNSNNKMSCPFITNGMVYELYYFFKERKATLTSLVNTLFRLKGEKPTKPILIATMARLHEVVKVLWEQKYMNNLDMPFEEFSLHQSTESSFHNQKLRPLIYNVPFDSDDNFSVNDEFECNEGFPIIEPLFNEVVEKKNKITSIDKEMVKTKKNESYPMSEKSGLNIVDHDQDTISFTPENNKKTILLSNTKSETTINLMNSDEIDGNPVSSKLNKIHITKDIKVEEINVSTNIEEKNLNEPLLLGKDINNCEVKSLKDLKKICDVEMEINTIDRKPVITSSQDCPMTKLHKEKIKLKNKNISPIKCSLKLQSNKNTESKNGSIHLNIEDSCQEKILNKSSKDRITKKQKDVSPQKSLTRLQSKKTPQNEWKKVSIQLNNDTLDQEKMVKTSKEKVTLKQKNVTNLKSSPKLQYNKKSSMQNIVARDESKKESIELNKKNSDQEKNSDGTFDLNLTKGTSGKITRGDIVYLYTKWLKKKLEDKDCVFVSDLLMDVEILKIERKVSDIRVPVGTLMSSSVKLFEDFRSLAKSSMTEARNYLLVNWMEDLDCLVNTKTGVRNYTPKTTDSLITSHKKHKSIVPNNVDAPPSSNDLTNKTPENKQNATCKLMKGDNVLKAINNVNIDAHNNKTLQIDKKESSSPILKLKTKPNMSSCSTGKNSTNCKKVKKIIGYRIVKLDGKSVTEYRVRYISMPPSCDAWIEQAGVANNLIKSFWDALKKQRTKRDESNEKKSNKCDLEKVQDNSEIDHKTMAEYFNDNFIHNLDTNLVNYHLEFQKDLSRRVKVTKAEVLKLYDNWRNQNKEAIAMKTAGIINVGSLIDSVKNLMGEKKVRNFNSECIVDACFRISLIRSKLNGKVLEKYLESDFTEFMKASGKHQSWLREENIMETDIEDSADSDTTSELIHCSELQNLDLAIIIDRIKKEPELKKKVENCLQKQTMNPFKKLKLMDHSSKVYADLTELGVTKECIDSIIKLQM